jgi:S-adenosylmethionine hydrolase
VIFLCTDFGLADAYVGIVKAVIASIAPDARVLDLAHELPPQDLRAGSHALYAAAPYLPAGAIVVAVVDPGVGSARRRVVVRGTRCTWIAPDNGLVGAALALDPPMEARALESEAHRLPRAAHTFDGRDVFGPAAAHLSRGVPLEALGPAIPLASLVPAPVLPTDADTGEIWCFDRYGNAITNLRAPLGARGSVQVGDHTLALGTHFASVPVGAPLAMVGSSGLVELAVRDGSAREALALRGGDAVRRVAA